MIKFLSSLSILIFILSCGNSKKGTDCDFLPLTDWTIIQSDVVVRQDESILSERIAGLKQLDEVNVLRKGKKEVIDGIEDHWYKVGYKKGQSGWVFGHYTSLKMEGQKSIILPFEDYSFGDLAHISFGSYDQSEDPNKYIDFGSGNNNFCGYELEAEDNEGYSTGNPAYKGKKFKIIYNDVIAKTYCNAPIDFDICIKPTPSIVKLELIE